MAVIVLVVDVVRPPRDPSSEPSTALSNGVITTTAPHIGDPDGLLGDALAEASPDLMRSLLQTVINALLSADADAVVGAEYGRPTPGRSAQRNGYRHRDLDTRVGTVDVAVPKLPTGSYFPDRRPFLEQASTCATFVAMSTVGLRELRQDASELVRRVEAGEEITITVAGRPSARLVSATAQPWRSFEAIADLFDGPADTVWDADRDRIDQTVRDPWSVA